jgi:hypothetical protein
MNEVRVPISPGELLDKITILRIKSRRMADPDKLVNVRRELDALEETWNSSAYAAHDEDEIRDKERAKSFDAEFIRLARAVYIENDERAAIKKRLNQQLGSTLIEEKSYAEYKG